MCSRLACVEVVGCVLGGVGTAIEFVCDHGVNISPGGICADWLPLFGHVRVESGADAIRVTFYIFHRRRQRKNRTEE